MKQAIFRIFGGLLGVGALFIAIFSPENLSDNVWLIARNLFFGLLLLAYALLGPKFITKIPLIKVFVSNEKKESN